MKHLENEMADLKKRLSVIKTFLISKSFRNELGQAIAPTKRQEPPAKPVEELDGIRIRGVPEKN